MGTLECRDEVRGCPGLGHRYDKGSRREDVAMQDGGDAWRREPRWESEDLGHEVLGIDGRMVAGSPRDEDDRIRVIGQNAGCFAECCFLNVQQFEPSARLLPDF
jgi:hypothetical protein